MDSSWTPEEKQAVRKLVQDAALDIMDVLSAQADARDPTDLEKVRVFLKEISINVEYADMILFSGERGTSIYNRLLVLILRSAEILKHRGEPAVWHFWRSNRRYNPEEDPEIDLGDGDDTVFDCRDYATAEDIIAAYKCYGKIIEPVISSTAIEVLSRYSFLSAKGKFYALVKAKKNVQRICYSRRSTTVVTDGEVDKHVSASELAEFATAQFQRAIAAAHTPVVRQIALISGEYQMKKAIEAGHLEVVYDRDLLRRRPELANERTTLCQLAETARDTIKNAHCNGFVMEHWQHFPYGSSTDKPNGRLMEARAVEWMDADAAMAEVTIGDEDMLTGEAFLGRCHMSRHIAECMGVKNLTLLMCCPAGAVHLATDRSAVGRVGGKNGLASHKKSDGDSESKASTTARSAPHSSGKKKPVQTTKAGPSARHAGRSRTGGLAAPGNTDGLAAVPAL
jgi:hypothetical protein